MCTNNICTYGLDMFSYCFLRLCPSKSLPKAAKSPRKYQRYISKPPKPFRKIPKTSPKPPANLPKTSAKQAHSNR